jgi:hypothetical protein
MGRRFTVIESFHSDELQREFVAGRTYETSGQDDAMVAELINKWVADGKVSTVESEIEPKNENEHENEHEPGHESETEIEHEHEHEHEHEPEDEDDDEGEDKEPA